MLNARQNHFIDAKTKMHTAMARVSGKYEISFILTPDKYTFDVKFLR